MPPSLEHLAAEAWRYASPPSVYVLTWIDRHTGHSQTSTDLSKLMDYAERLAQQGAAVWIVAANKE